MFVSAHCVTIFSPHMQLHTCSCIDIRSTVFVQRVRRLPTMEACRLSVDDVCTLYLQLLVQRSSLCGMFRETLLRRPDCRGCVSVTPLHAK
jgi:hypothetical protein